MGGDDDDDEDYDGEDIEDLEDLDENDLEEMMGFHQHGAGCAHGDDEDSESLLEVLPNLLSKGKPTEEEEEGDDKKNEDESDEDEDEDEDEEGVEMSPEEAFTSVLMDTLQSIAHSESPSQIEEFVKGGGVGVLIEAVNTCGIALDEKAILEEVVPDASYQGRIALEIMSGLLEIGDYWTQNDEDDQQEEEGVLKNAFVDALVESGESVLIPFMEMCCNQLKIHLESPLSVFAKIINILARTLSSGLRGASKESWPESIMNFWDKNVEIVIVTGDKLLLKAQELQEKVQNPEQTEQPKEKTKAASKKGKKEKKGKKKATKSEPVNDDAALIALAEQMSVVETWAEVVSALILGGLDLSQQAALLLTSVSHSRRKMLGKCKCKACTEIKSTHEDLYNLWINHIAHRFFEPQYEIVINLLVKAVDLLMNSRLETALGAGVTEAGMAPQGVGDCAGLHHAMGALHGLALLDACKLPQALGPMLLRRAEQMWSLMLKDPHGVGSGSDVMFVRILGILQTLTNKAPSTHKHHLRQNLHKSTPPPDPEIEHTTPTVSHDLLQSVVSFLGTCSRKKNSPLLRDALRSVVDTLDLLSLEKELYKGENVNVDLDKAIWTTTVTRALVQGLERDLTLAAENSHLAADAFRVLSYALSHPDDMVAATVARELKLSSVGLMDAVKAASQTCHELAYWAQQAYIVLQTIPQAAIAQVELNMPEEELVINTQQDEEEDETGGLMGGMMGMPGMMPGMGMPGMMPGMGMPGMGMPGMQGMGGMEQAFLAQMLNSMMMGGGEEDDDEDEEEYEPVPKRASKKAKGGRSGVRHKRR